MPLSRLPVLSRRKEEGPQLAVLEARADDLAAFIDRISVGELPARVGGNQVVQVLDLPILPQYGRELLLLALAGVVPRPPDHQAGLVDVACPAVEVTRQMVEVAYLRLPNLVSVVEECKTSGRVLWSGGGVGPPDHISGVVEIHRLAVGMYGMIEQIAKLVH